MLNEKFARKDIDGLFEGEKHGAIERVSGCCFLSFTLRLFRWRRQGRVADILIPQGMSVTVPRLEDSITACTAILLI